MYGLNVKQLKSLVLNSLEVFEGKNTAVNLVLGTMMAESNLSYIEQFPVGHALGLAQMEKVTFYDMRDRILKKDVELSKKFKELIKYVPEWEDLKRDIVLNILMCRLKYISSPLPLPATNNALGLARYHKRVYNTDLGKADPSVNSKTFMDAINA